MAWTSYLVPWRSVRGSRVVKITARSAPLHHVQSPLCPHWWAIFPPDEKVLRGMFWCGYQDMARWASAPPLPSDCCRCRPKAKAAASTTKASGGSGDSNGSSRGRRDDRRGILLRGRSSTEDVDPEEEEDGDAIWHDVQKALAKRPQDGKLLPDRDPTSGESVEELLAIFHTARDAGNAVVWKAVLVVLPIVLALPAYVLLYT
eukprot:TRINITY_DN32673_c0_g1_i1.p1 TRINITY_DN32673_c0_g1~~TRINITY_DN32673_c0_g1_i1.p1  ORF type:complete len:238 (-),score=35.41 TRINITY_DN32673_c0_g1_i1:93-701(-)